MQFNTITGPEPACGVYSVQHIFDRLTKKTMHMCVHSAYLRMILLRSFATFLLHSGQADEASAIAADVSLAFMQGTVAMTSPVAGFLTCTKDS